MQDASTFSNRFSFFRCATLSLFFLIFYFFRPFLYFPTVRALLGCFCYPRKFDHLVVFYCSSARVFLSKCQIDNENRGNSQPFSGQKLYRFSAGGGRSQSFQFLFFTFWSRRQGLIKIENWADDSEKRSAGTNDWMIRSQENYWVVFYCRVF